MAKKQSKSLLQQKIALGLFALTLIGIVSYLGIKTFEDAPLGEFVEGEHYQLLENPRRVRGDKVEVMEFFSYGCVHCFNFEPMLADWVESKGSDINFVRTPAIANDYWRILGRAYFTLDQMEVLEDKHMAMFRAIHQSRSDLSTPEALFSTPEALCSTPEAQIVYKILYIILDYMRFYVDYMRFLFGLYSFLDGLYVFLGGRYVF